MQRAVLFALALFVAAGVGSSYATTAPRDGGPLPKAYLDRLADDRTAYQMQRAWIHKVRRIKVARDAYLARQLETYGPQALQAALPSQFVVSGTVAVPVVVGYFQGHSVPYSASTLQDKLFDGPSGTITDYYSEVSYGNINMTGTVWGWDQVSQVDTYYAGSSNGLVPGDARTGEFIKELLDANDAAVDFSQYDNDGPDGVPNSGDDDGYADFVAFVHNEAGGECTGNNNIWSHRWIYEQWPASGGLPYTTNDPAAGGGFILVSDYVIQPAYNCSSLGGGVIDIGVFCHEFGHAFGLPDLYDTRGYNDGNGIGFWGIMGAGNWNSPSSPAHPCAWTREALGWVTPTVIDWNETDVDIRAINTNPVAFKLPFSSERWRRNSACAVNGSYSLYCGLTEAEGTARHWSSPGPNGGYGSNWVETVERDFTYSGTGSVSLEYDYAHDTEPPYQGYIYDVAHAVIEVQGVETILATYHGVGSGTETIDITPHLSPLSGAGGTYTVKFRFTSDLSFADDDGNYESACGAIAVDDVSVTGGGENYSTDFETWADGWHQDCPPDANGEYWLVENRRPIGFDSQLIEPGLLIMHIDQEVMWAPFLGNSGGSSNLQVRGVCVEEANGDFDLNGVSSNRGEDTDPFPGAANKTSFTSGTTPSSSDNNGQPTRIQVTNISAAAPVMSATMRAGNPAPQASALAPSGTDNNEVAVQVAVTGDLICYGADFHFVHASVPGAGEIPGTVVEWVDPTRITGSINVYGREPGDWDLIVTNPDGQTVTLPAALAINSVIVATQLQSASLEALRGAVELAYELHGQERGEVIRLYRSNSGAGDWRLLADDLRGDSRGVYRYRDTAVEPGTTYDYLLASYLGGEERELHQGSATVPAQALALSQNVPNPFNPTTTIRFTLPERAAVLLSVYDVSGALVRELANGEYGAGPHDVEWNGRDDRGNAVGSGVYFYRLITDKRTLTRKMTLLK
jgi:M6 family metalloprotease-like protein